MLPGRRWANRSIFLDIAPIAVRRPPDGPGRSDRPLGRWRWRHPRSPWRRRYPRCPRRRRHRGRSRWPYRRLRPRRRPVPWLRRSRANGSGYPLTGRRPGWCPWLGFGTFDTTSHVAWRPLRSLSRGPVRTFHRRNERLRGYGILHPSLDAPAHLVRPTDRRDDRVDRLLARQQRWVRVAARMRTARSDVRLFPAGTVASVPVSPSLAPTPVAIMPASILVPPPVAGPSVPVVSLAMAVANPCVRVAGLAVPMPGISTVFVSTVVAVHDDRIHPSDPVVVVVAVIDSVVV